MKTLIVFLLALSLGIVSVQAQAQNRIKVGTTTGADVEILKKVKAVAAKNGLQVEIVKFSGFTAPNDALVEKEVDLNSFQHQPHLDTFNAKRKLNLVSVGTTYISPLGYFSKKINSLDELKEGDILAIPDDPTNSGRALLLLQQAGVIKLDPKAGLTATLHDIVENPLDLNIIQVDAPRITDTLEDVAAAAINNTYAIPIGLNPLKDAIYLEGFESPYVNIIVAREAEKNNPLYKKFVEAYQSQEVADFIIERYKGATVPAFKYESESQLPD